MDRLFLGSGYARFLKTMSLRKKSQNLVNQNLKQSANVIAQNKYDKTASIA